MAARVAARQREAPRRSDAATTVDGAERRWQAQRGDNGGRGTETRQSAVAAAAQQLQMRRRDNNIKLSFLFKK